MAVKRWLFCIATFYILICFLSAYCVAQTSGGGTGGGGAVNSVFGRAGNVTAASNDYTILQIQNALDSLLTRVPIGDSGHLYVKSVNGLHGSVVLGIPDTTSLSFRITQKQSNSDTNTVDATRSWVLSLGYISSVDSTLFVTLKRLSDSINTALRYRDSTTKYVVSFKGRFGSVVPASGDYTTSQVTEGSNLYYTDARARASQSANSPATYNSGTGAHGVDTTVVQTKLSFSSPLSLSGNVVSLTTPLTFTQGGTNTTSFPNMSIPYSTGSAFTTINTLYYNGTGNGNVFGLAELDVPNYIHNWNGAIGIQGHWVKSPFATDRVGINSNLWVEKRIWGDEWLGLTTLGEAGATVRTTLAASVAVGDSIAKLASTSGWSQDQEAYVGVAGSNLDILDIRKVSNDTLYFSDIFRYTHSSGDSVIMNRWRGSLTPIAWTNYDVGGILVLGADQTATEVAIDSPTVRVANHTRFQIRNYSGILNANNGTVSPATIGNMLTYSNPTLNADTTGGHLATKSDTLILGNEIRQRATTATTITINGTTNQITSSAGAQDLSANRTWTLSTPQNIDTAASTQFGNGKREGNASTLSWDITASDKNVNRTSASQRRDTSNVNVQFTGSGKPLLTITGAIGNNILANDSIGRLLIGETWNNNPRSTQTMLQLTPFDTTNVGSVELVMSPTSNNSAAIRSYMTAVAGLNQVTAIGANKNTLTISGGGADGSVYSGIGGNINWTTGAAWTSTSHPLMLVFAVNQTGTTSRTNAFQIDTSLDIHAYGKLALGYGNVTTQAGAYFDLNGKLQANNNGIDTKRNNITLPTPESYQYPNIVDTVSMSGQAAAIAATNLNSTSTNGVYKVSAYIYTSTAGSAGTLDVRLYWNDGAADSVVSSTIALGTLGNSASLNGIVCRVTNSSAIQFKTTIPIAFVGSPVYEVEVFAERIF